MISFNDNVWGWSLYLRIKDIVYAYKIQGKFSKTMFKDNVQWSGLWIK
jgi:hypothetical protein